MTNHERILATISDMEVSTCRASLRIYVMLLSGLRCLRLSAGDLCRMAWIEPDQVEAWVCNEWQQVGS